MKKLNIRLAHSEEKKALEELQWRASLNNEGDRTALLANPGAIDLPLSQIEDELVFVAEEEGKTKGFAAILLRDDDDIELDSLFVEPDFWRQGVGRSLVEHCSLEASAKGANLLHVTGNPHAEGFYESGDFEVMGKSVTRFGVGLLMKRTL